MFASPHARIRVLVLLVTCLSLFLPGKSSFAMPGQASQTVYKFGVTAELGGKLEIVAAQGNYTYVAEGARLRIFDHTAAGGPVQVGMTGILPTTIDAMTVAGDWAYLVGDYYTSALMVVNVSNRAAPSLVSMVDLPAGPMRVAAVPGYAYVTTQSGVQIVNASDPAKPVLAGMYTTKTSPRGITVSGSTLFFETPGSIEALNIQNPAQPTSITKNTSTTNNPTAGLLAANGIIFQTTSSGLDFYNPTTLALISSLPVSGQPMSVSIANNIAVLASQQQGIYLADVSNVSNLSTTKVIGTLNTPGYTRSAVWSGSKILVADGNGLLQVNASTLTAPVLEKSLLVGEYFGMSISGSTLFTSDRSGDLVSVDLTNPDQPGELDRLTLNGGVVFIETDADYAYITLGSGGLAIADIRDPQNLSLVHEISSVAAGASFRKAWVHGTYLYALLSNDTITAFDLSDRTAPIKKGFASGFAPYNPSPMRFYGSYAYYVNAANDLEILDLTDPGLPKSVGTVAMTYLYDLEISGSTLFAVDTYLEQVILYSLTSPSAPQQVGTWDTFARNVEVNDGIMAADAAEFCLVDVQDPVVPQTLTCSPARYHRNEMKWHHDRIIVMEGSGAGLLVFFPEPLKNQVFTPLLTR